MQNLKSFSDEELVEKTRNENKEYYEEIVLRYQKKLVDYAYYLTSDEQKAEDIVQNAFIKAFVNLKGFNIKKKFSSWIYRIVHNEAINQIKKFSKEFILFENFKFEDKQNIEEDFLSKEDILKVRSCLKKISLKYKEPLVLFYFEDRTYEEISDILRIPVSTVGVRIKRAKASLKKICQEKNR